MKRIPKYAKHKTGQARVRLDRKDIYLGLYDSPESHKKYNALVADLLTHRHENLTVTIDQLAIRFTQRVNRPDDWPTPNRQCGISSRITDLTRPANSVRRNWNPFDVG